MSRVHTTDVVIVGGGVIGCAIAYHLRKAGANVIVVERAEVAAEASSAAAGLLAPPGEISDPGEYTDLLLASWSLYSELIPALEEASSVRALPGCFQVLFGWYRRLEARPLQDMGRAASLVA